MVIFSITETTLSMVTPRSIQVAIPTFRVLYSIWDTIHIHAWVNVVTQLLRDSGSANSCGLGQLPLWLLYTIKPFKTTVFSSCQKPGLLQSVVFLYICSFMIKLGSCRMWSQFLNQQTTQALPITGQFLSCLC